MGHFRERIIVDSAVHFGKPCIAGTRIPVEAVMELVQEGIPFAEISERYYPDLTLEDVKATHHREHGGHGGGQKTEDGGRTADLGAER
ncbi:MAG: DUF433 domain-containing protein [Verrucomicrobiia bacterium]